MSLLDKALSSHIQKKQKKFSKEEIELAIAWVSGKVSTGQVSYALGKKKGVYSFIAQAIRYNTTA